MTERRTGRCSKRSNAVPQKKKKHRSTEEMGGLFQKHRSVDGSSAARGCNGQPSKTADALTVDQRTFSCMRNSPSARICSQCSQNTGNRKVALCARQSAHMCRVRRDCVESTKCSVFVAAYFVAMCIVRCAGPKAARSAFIS